MNSISLASTKNGHKCPWWSRLGESKSGLRRGRSWACTFFSRGCESSLFLFSFDLVILSSVSIGCSSPSCCTTSDFFDFLIILFPSPNSTFDFNFFFGFSVSPCCCSSCCTIRFFVGLAICTGAFLTGGSWWWVFFCFLLGEGVPSWGGSWALVFLVWWNSSPFDFDFFGLGSSSSLSSCLLFFWPSPPWAFRLKGVLPKKSHY